MILLYLSLKKSSDKSVVIAAIFLRPLMIMMLTKSIYTYFPTLARMILSNKIDIYTILHYKFEIKDNHSRHVKELLLC
jgi:hypothetical protein